MGRTLYGYLTPDGRFKYGEQEGSTVPSEGSTLILSTL